MTHRLTIRTESGLIEIYTVDALWLGVYRSDADQAVWPIWANRLEDLFVEFGVSL